MKYDERACHFNMDTGCVKLLLRDGRAVRVVLPYLQCPLGYADLILNGNPEEYLKNVAGIHGLED